MARPRAYLHRLVRKTLGLPWIERQILEIQAELDVLRHGPSGVAGQGPERTVPREPSLSVKRLADLDFATAGRILDAARKPTDDLTIGYYVAQRALSYVAWELFSREACVHFARSKRRSTPPKIEERGFWQGAIDPVEAATLKSLFAACRQIPFAAEDHDPKYFYEPRLPNHEFLSSTNTYFEPTLQLRSHIEETLRRMSGELEDLCGHFWRVGSWRVFELTAEKVENITFMWMGGRRR